MLQRDVALTVLRRLAPEGGAIGGDADPTGTARAGEMLVRALRTGSFEHPGCARLLDVLAPGASGVPDDVLGAAVTEWVPGRSLAEAVADGLIKPFAAARAVAPARRGRRGGPPARARAGLRPPAARAHHPGGPRADVLRPAATRPAARRRRPRPRRRPLRPAHRRAGRCRSPTPPVRASARPSASTASCPRRPRSGPACPSSWMRWSPGRSARSAAPGTCTPPPRSHRLLDEVVAEDDRIALFPPEPDGVPSGPGDVWQDGARAHTAPDPARRRKLLVGLAGLAIAVLLVLGFVGSQVGSLFSDGRGAPVIVVDNDAAPQPGAPGSGGGARPGGGRAGRGRRDRGLRPHRRSRQRGPGVARHRRQRRHQLAHLRLPAAVPGAQAGRRDHGVVRVGGAAHGVDDRVAEPGHGDPGAVGAGRRRRARRHHASSPKAPSARAAPRSRWPAASRSPTCCCGSRSSAGAAREHHADQRGAVPAAQAPDRRLRRRSRGVFPIAHGAADPAS